MTMFIVHAAYMVMSSCKTGFDGKYSGTENSLGYKCDNNNVKLRLDCPGFLFSHKDHETKEHSYYRIASYI